MPFIPYSLKLINAVVCFVNNMLLVFTVVCREKDVMFRNTLSQDNYSLELCPQLKYWYNEEGARKSQHFMTMCRAGSILFQKRL